MFREPVKVLIKTTINFDPSAQARSAIRRPPVGGQRYHHSASRRRASGRTAYPDQQLAQPSQIAQRSRHDGDQAPAAFDGTPVEEMALQIRIEAAADLARFQASNRSRQEGGRSTLRDSLSYEHPPSRRRRVRESALRYETRPPISTVQEVGSVSRRRTSQVANAWQTTLPRASELDQSPPPRSPLLPRLIPEPPNTPGEAVARSNAVERAFIHFNSGRGGHASLTPRFAPAHRFDDPVEMEPFEYASMPQPSHSSDFSGVNIEDLHGLRRNRYRTMSNAPYDYAAAIPTDPVDGLGDRRRSFSTEENTWETLRTTITPDNRLPSASSSFTSATASVSSLNYGSGSGTQPTAASSASAALEALHCMSEDPSDSDFSGTDDDFAPEQQHTLQQQPESHVEPHPQPFRGPWFPDISSTPVLGLNASDPQDHYARQARLERMAADLSNRLGRPIRNFEGRLDRIERERL